MAAVKAVEFGQLTPMLPTTADFARSVDFYEKTLGFTSRYQDDGMAIMVRDSTEIILQNYVDAHVASQTAVRIRVSDVDALYAEYSAKNIPPFEADVENAGISRLEVKPWGTKEFAVRDLAGVCLTFYQRLS